MKIFLLYLLRWLLCIPMPNRLRDFIMWPVATRLLGKDFQMQVQFPSGLIMRAGMRDALDREMLLCGWRSNAIWEPGTIRLLHRLMPEVSAAAMAGAHVGYLVLRAAESNRAAEIHTFEPVASLALRAQANIDLNKARVTLTRAALGAHDREAHIEGDDVRAHIGESGPLVPMRSLSSYAKERGIASFELVLLDVEGYELEALEGLAALAPRDLIVEISPRTTPLDKIQSVRTLLLARGYALYRIDEETGALAPLSPSWDELLRHRNTNILATKRRDIL